MQPRHRQGFLHRRRRDGAQAETFDETRYTLDFLLFINRAHVVRLSSIEFGR